MNRLLDRNRTTPETVQDQLRAQPNLKLFLKKAPRQTVESVCTRPSQEWRRAPATPLMVTPIIAWRKLCAKTGGGICLGTFYRWIKLGKVYTVRMGAKAFVPVTALDDLIKRCLAGDNL